MLLNAVVHREYSFSSSTIINIYDDRIEFISLDGIVSGLSLKAIMLGVSQSRNEKLANIFYRLHLIEAYGTGIQKIMLSYEKYEKKPIIKAEIGGFQVTLSNIHYKENNEEKEIEKTFSFSEQQKTILKLLEQKQKSRKEIEGHIGLSQSRVITLLKELVQLKVVEKIGAGKNTKYMLKIK